MARKFTTSSVTERHATLKTNRAQLEDAGVFTCKAENPAGAATTTCRVKVTQKPVIKLEAPRDASEKVSGRVSDGQMTGHAHGRLVLEAVCESVPGCETFTWFHNGEPLEDTTRRTVERNLGDARPRDWPSSAVKTRERLVINKLELSDTGVYRVEAKNDAGRTDTALTFVVQDKPQPPAHVNAIKTRETDSCFVQWHRSPSDGGSKITQYVVESLVVAPSKTESSPSATADWTVIGKTSASELEFKAKNLKLGVLYAFRVSAENEIGRSEPNEMDSPIVLQEKTRMSLLVRHSTFLLKLQLICFFFLIL